MSETDDLGRAIAQSIRDAVGSLPVRTVIGRIVAIGESKTADTGIESIHVTLPSGRTECEWLSSVAAEIVAHQPVSLLGSDALVEIVGGRTIVTGIIWTGA